MSARAIRLTAVAGIASFALIIMAALVSPPLWDSPGTDASSAEVAEYVGENQNRAIAALFIYSLGMGFFLCFAAGLWSWMKLVEPAPQPLAAVFAFGAVGAALLILAAFATAGVMNYRDFDNPDLVGLLADVSFGLLAVSGIPTAVFLGAYAALVFRYRCLPVWTAWLAVVGAVAHVFIAASFMSHGDFLALESPVIVWVPATYFAWILAAAVALLRQQPFTRD